jgi:hypothetical protein
LAKGPRRRRFLSVFSAGKNTLNAQSEVIPFGNERSKSWGSDIDVSTSGCVSSFYQAAPRTIRGGKRLGFMVMLFFMIVIRVVLMMVMTFVICRSTASPR